MAKRKGIGYLQGQTYGRSQSYNDKTGTYTILDTETGKFTRGGKKSPYKNVRNELIYTFYTVTRSNEASSLSLNSSSFWVSS